MHIRRNFCLRAAPSKDGGDVLRPRRRRRQSVQRYAFGCHRHLTNFELALLFGDDSHQLQRWLIGFTGISSDHVRSQVQISIFAFALILFSGRAVFAGQFVSSMLKTLKHVLTCFCKRAASAKIAATISTKTRLHVVERFRASVAFMRRQRPIVALVDWMHGYFLGSSIVSTSTYLLFILALCAHV